MNAIYKWIIHSYFNKLFAIQAKAAGLLRDTCGQWQCPVSPLRSSLGWRIGDNWGDRGLGLRLEIEAWGRDIKGGNLFHLRIRLSWPGLDTADCQGLISGAGTKAAVQSASNIINNRRSVAAFLASFIPFSKFIQSAIFIHFNFEAAYKYKLSASSRDINNADSASEENVNKVET